jgi:hypothetical protein
MQLKVYKYYPNPDFSGFRKKIDREEAEVAPTFFRQLENLKKKKKN